MQRYFSLTNWREIQLRRLAGGHRGASLVAMSRAGEIVALGNVFPEAGGDGRTGEVALIVADANQGTGVGTALLARLLQTATRIGFSQVVAHVLADNAGHEAPARGDRPDLDDDGGGGRGQHDRAVGCCRRAVSPLAVPDPWWVALDVRGWPVPASAPYGEGHVDLEGHAGGRIPRPVVAFPVAHGGDRRPGTLAERHPRRRAGATQVVPALSHPRRTAWLPHRQH